MLYNLIVVLFVSNQLYWFTHATENSSNAKLTAIRNTKLPACQACKMMVDSFTRESERLTQLYQFSAADSNLHRQEETLELVFTNMCRDNSAKYQCLAFVHKCKKDITDWWYSGRFQTPDLIQYLCIDELRYCCPNGHYGPNCNPCPGYPNQVCSNNGKCKGNGTRKGNGQCSCDAGYAGDMCDQCAVSYFLSYKDDNKLLCTQCHVSCDGNCSQAGTRGCEFCRDGWRKEKTRGCVDINECFNKEPPCKKHQFCVNNEGSYSCLACDNACDTCIGDGPDMCGKCAPGFVLQHKICVSDKSRMSYSDATRYLTYVGLCIATFIVFQNSPYAAGCIGICVAIYVTVAEYMLGRLKHVHSLADATEVLQRIFQN